MNTEELKENKYITYRCKPKRNSVLTVYDFMSIALYTTQKWEVIYTGEGNRDRCYRVNRKNVTLYMTEIEFNENFELKYKMGA